MKMIKTADSVGSVLCHDITQIIPGVKKGPVFKKGHIVREEDIPVLLSCGKENLYVWEPREDMLHENDAAYILKDICIGNSDSFTYSEPSEGKIEIQASVRGLLKINTAALNAVNALGEMMIATIKGNFPVEIGEKIAATRIIPLVIGKEKMDAAHKTAGSSSILSLLRFTHKRVSIITTGNEVYSGRIKDSFGPVLRRKLAVYDTEIIGQTFTDDSTEMIVNAIGCAVYDDADMVIVSGGMSVDPDDRTPGAIKAAGAEIVTYGAPVLPGAMFLLSYLRHNGRIIPVIGLPGCVMYAKRTVFDLILPRILADEKLTAADISIYGEGGLCLGCDSCTFPHCGFGK